MKNILTLCLILAAVPLAVEVVAQDRWAVADVSTVRLSSTAFSRLPNNVARYLSAQGCTIPQTYLENKPHNVISGEFTKRGQLDWAVLCSRNGESSILVFKGGSTKHVSAIARQPDSNYLQTITEGGKIGFSRLIGVVGRDVILKHYREFRGRKPPPLRHQGIDDAFAEKASAVHYYYRGKWIRLKGAD